MGAPPERAWRATRTWPLAEERRTRFYLRAGPSQTSTSSNDGTLSPDAPEEGGRDDYTVDPGATSGKPSRWSNAYGDGGPGFQYPDLSAMDARGLTYTSAPLARDSEVTGHPVAHLWLECTARDADVFVFLEEVEADGSSRYVTEGALRASMRATGEPPYERLGLPYQRCSAADARDLPDEPVELVFDLLPTSNLFDAGHRIRLTILGADALNARTPRSDPPPRFALLRERERGSYVELPLIPEKDAR
jgi:hypothetical protein